MLLTRHVIRGRCNRGELSCRSVPSGHHRQWIGPRRLDDQLPWSATEELRLRDGQPSELYEVDRPTDDGVSEDEDGSPDSDGTEIHVPREY